MSVKIKCINKDGGNHQNPYEGITHFGWVNEQNGTSGKSTLEEMIIFLEKQGGVAYVKDNNNVAYIGIVFTAHGTKYLRTYADGKWTDNLLSLPEC